MPIVQGRWINPEKFAALEAAEEEDVPEEAEGLRVLTRGEKAALTRSLNAAAKAAAEQAAIDAATVEPDADTEQDESSTASGGDEPDDELSAAERSQALLADAE